MVHSSVRDDLWIVAADYYPWITDRTQRAKTSSSHLTGLLPAHLPVALEFFDAHSLRRAQSSTRKVFDAQSAIAAAPGLIGDGSLIAGFPVNDSPSGNLAVSSVLIADDGQRMPFAISSRRCGGSQTSHV